MSASGVVSRPFVRPPAYAPLRVGYRIYYIYIRSVVLVTDFFFSYQQICIRLQVFDEHDVRAPDVVLNEYYFGETERKQIWELGRERREGEQPQIKVNLVTVRNFAVQPSFLKTFYSNSPRDLMPTPSLRA